MGFALTIDLPVLAESRALGATLLGLLHFVLDVRLGAGAGRPVGSSRTYFDSRWFNADNEPYVNCSSFRGLLWPCPVLASQGR